MRSTLDFSPLLRTAIGFDRMAHMLESAVDGSAQGFPPYNIEKVDEDSYRLSMAVAGFSHDDLEMTVQDGVLTVKGAIKSDDTDSGETDTRTYLHRGIALRSFERRFQLTDHIEVKDARLENGLLHVELQREVPEAAKPKVIAISGGDATSAKRLTNNKNKAKDVTAEEISEAA